jgi:hypothetical protein
VIIACLAISNVVWRLWFRPETERREQQTWDYLLWKGEFAQ